MVKWYYVIEPIFVVIIKNAIILTYSYWNYGSVEIHIDLKYFKLIPPKNCTLVNFHPFAINNIQLFHFHFSLKAKFSTYFQFTKKYAIYSSEILIIIISMLYSLFLTLFTIIYRTAIYNTHNERYKTTL